MSTAEDFTIGWICALQEELDTACQMLDDEFEGIGTSEVNDNNTYVFGRIHNHNIVIACLPGGQYGISPAASTFKDMIRSFPKLRFALMVGIGGGAPTRDQEVRLGDVVVSEPRHELGGVVQFDLGKRLQDGSFLRKGQLNAPPQILLGALPVMRRLNNDPRKADRIAENIKRMEDWPNYRRPSTDHLYRADFEHKGGKTCAGCGTEGLINESNRTPRSHLQNRAVSVHYGTIASSNSVLKDAKQRDEFADDPALGVLCFEMEAAGLMNNFPCLVIRGICDYCDSHKNDEWHNFAALTAAAYARELLRIVIPQKVALEPSWVTKFDTTLRNIQGGVAEVMKHQHNQRDENLLKWLSPIDQNRFQADMARGRIKSGQSILQSPLFQIWLEVKNKTIFCPGIPGAGKSVLASLIIDELFKRRTQSTSSHKVGVAYIYCDFRNGYSVEDCLGTLIRHLAANEPEALALVRVLFNQCTGQSRLPTIEDLCSCLDTICGAYSRIFIVIDALDESDRVCCQQLLEQLFNLQKKRHINLLATSRHIPWIESLFKKEDYLEILAAKQDVASYVHSRMNKFPSFVNKDPQLQEEIGKEVAKAVDGMFLLARLHLESLAGEQTVKALRKALKEITKGPNTYQSAYDRAYEKVMERINGQRPQETTLAIQLLSWLACAKKNLSIEELREALTVEVGLDYLDETNTPDIARTVALCAGLVTVEDEGKSLQLIHYTTQEFLTRDFAGKNTPLPEAQSYITVTCVTYLMFRQFGSGPCSERGDLQARCDRNVFYQYAASHWGDHARDLKTLPEIVFEFLECTPKMAASCQILDHHGEFGEWVPGRCWTNCLHLVAYFGLSSTVERLIRNAIGDTNSKDEAGWTPLFVAVLRGHFTFVKLLSTMKSVDLESVSRSGCTLLSAAVLVDHEEIVRLLLDLNSVDVNRSEISGLGTALECAVRDKNERLVALLLATKGINVNTMSHGRFTPLMLAIDRGSTAVVKLLLAHDGVAINAERPEDLSPLVLALEGDHIAEAELLLEQKSLDVNARDHLGQTPLLWLARASRPSTNNLVSILIKKDGIDLNAQDREGRTALSLAASRGNLDMVKLLAYAKGVDIELPCNADRTPLAWAAGRAPAVVEFILSVQRANVDSKDKHAQLLLS
ncbi:putative ankyrin repeat protein [Paramyrothecium foliicola]|nr:putative ankyrin repeat protein [Paramyrothecium foliicola]